jgi:UDP-glucuronate 4-epimerase
MVERLECVLGVKALIERMPEQLGDVPQTWADIGKAGRLLGYVPRTSFEEGMAQFAEWLRGDRMAVPATVRA